MVYTAIDLKKSFSRVARARKGNKEFANDAGYWDGGKCNWGANHSLKSDCETLAGTFNKLDSLANVKKELKECTSKSEYDAKKVNYLRKIEETEAGIKSDHSSYLFGICIIWEHEIANKQIESKAKICQEELKKLKLALEKSNYEWVQELKELDAEINEINQRMEENKRKAMKSDISPSEKAALIQLIEEDGNLLQQKYGKKRELSNKFNFDPTKKVRGIIDAMKKAIEKGNRSKSNNPFKNSRNATDNSGNNQDNSDNESSSDEGYSPNPNKDEKGNYPLDWFQENKQLVILASITLLTTFYIYLQPEETTTNVHE